MKIRPFEYDVVSLTKYPKECAPASLGVFVVYSLLFICSIAVMYPSDHPNVVSEGSPSRMRRVLRISLGMTTRPKSSILLTIPVAFILINFLSSILFGQFLLRCPASASLCSLLADRCHSLSSLHLPLAALASLPRCFHNPLSLSVSFHGL